VRYTSKVAFVIPTYFLYNKNKQDSRRLLEHRFIPLSISVEITVVQVLAVSPTVLDPVLMRISGLGLNR
jgi:hypothetical protein